jgi:hypothetical protein
MSQPAQNMKTRPDALVPSKMSPGAQNMKNGPDTLGTAQNVFGSAKHEKWTRLPQYWPKRVWERKS